MYEITVEYPVLSERVILKLNKSEAFWDGKDMLSGNCR
jgi:hypothetical protein